MVETMSEARRQELLGQLECATTEAELSAIEAAFNASEDSRWIVKTLIEVSQFFGIHESTAKAWRADGAPSDVGFYDLQAITRWRIGKAERRGLSVGDASDRELIRKKLRIDIQKRQLELDERTNKLVERDAVEGKLLEMFSVIRARLQSLPGEIASGVPAAVRNQVLEESAAKVTAALKELSKRAD